MLAEEKEGVTDNSDGDSGGGIRREDTVTAPIKITRSGPSHFIASSSDGGARQLPLQLMLCLLTLAGRATAFGCRLIVEVSLPSIGGRRCLTAVVLAVSDGLWSQHTDLGTGFVAERSALLCTLLL